MPPNKPGRKETKAEREERIRKQNEEDNTKKEREELERVERERMEEELRLKEEREKILKAKEEEIRMRGQHYQETKQVLDEFWSRLKISHRQRWDDILWQRYLRLEHIPDALSAPEINEYISRWRDKNAKETIDDVFQETPICLSLLEELNMALLEGTEESNKRVSNWKQSTKDLEMVLQEKLDEATYNLLLNCGELMDSSTFTTHESRASEHVSISVWANMSQNPRNKGFHFEESGYQFELPPELLLTNCAVRFMYTTFDHCSKYDKVTQEILDAAPAPPPSPEGGESMPVILDPEAYQVVGGLIHFNLLGMPPQPAYSAGWKIQRIESPSSLSRVGYRVLVIPARPPPTGMKPAEAAEFTEAELKRYDLEMSKTVQVTIKLPKKVIYLDQPNPALWDEENHYWTTRSIFDGKYEEDKGSLSFKLCEFGILGVVQRKHPNLPYQSWILEPREKDGEVLGSVSITGPLVHLVVLIKGALCKLTELHYGDQNIYNLFPHIGQDWKVAKGLLAELSKIGINTQPEGDAHKYIGMEPKDSPIEAWTYHCMALLATVYTFSFSRWNSTAGNDCIVIKCSQPNTDSNKDPTDSLVSIRKDRCHEVTCADVKQTYEEEVVDHDKVTIWNYSRLKPIRPRIIQERIRNDEANSYLARDRSLPQRVDGLG